MWLVLGQWELEVGFEFDEPVIFINRRAEFIEVFVTIAVESDEGWYVQRERSGFQCEWLDVVEEVVIAVDEDAGVFRGDCFLQIAGSHFQEVEVHGALDVLGFVVGFAAGIENESVPVLCHFEKLLDRNAAVFAVGLDFAGEINKCGEVDLWIFGARFVSGEK